MRKKILLISIMFITILFSPMSMVVSTKDNPSIVQTTANSLPIEEPKVFDADKASYENGTWAQWTTTAFTLDGNVSDWVTEGIIPEDFNGVTAYLAYDATNAYVALTWQDDTFDNDVSEWNKTSTEDNFEMLPGTDDIVTVGFHNGSYADLWTWTASNRTSNNFAFDHSWNNTIDGGTLPYIMNTNTTDFLGNSAPLWNNSWLPILDYSAIPQTTQITGWYPNQIIPTGSQADVALGWDYTGSHYVVEFMRALDTGQADDLVLDFTNNDLLFEIGVENKSEANDFDIILESYIIFHENTPAELTFNPIPAYTNEHLLIQGTAFDDYEDYVVEIWVDLWFITWGTSDYIAVNKVTGAWSYLLLFNEMDLPLYDITIFITIYPRYEDPITLNHTTTVEDIIAPSIIGITNVTNTYPEGVPKTTESVTITVGLSDDYNDVNNLIANLYWYKDGGIALAVPMSQFYPDSSTYRADITMDTSDDYSIQHNYTYFIEAWDTSSNKVTSFHYDFFTAKTVTTSPTPTITPTTIITEVPFNSIIGSLIFSGCLIIIVRFKKRRIN